MASVQVMASENGPYKVTGEMSSSTTTATSSTPAEKRRYSSAVCGGSTNQGATAPTPRSASRRRWPPSRRGVAAARRRLHRRILFGWFWWLTRRPDRVTDGALIASVALTICNLHVPQDWFTRLPACGMFNSGSGSSRCWRAGVMSLVAPRALVPDAERRMRSR